MNQRPGDGDPLLLPPGETVGVAAGAVRKADLIQERFRASFPRLGANPFQLQRKKKILQNGEGGDEIEELEDEADVGAAKESPLPLGEPGELRAADGHLPRSGQIDAADEVEERRLPGAASPHQGDELPPAELGAEVLQDHPLAVTLGIDPGQPLKADQPQHTSGVVLIDLPHAFHFTPPQSRR